MHNQETDDKIVYSYNGENMRLGMNDKSGLSITLYDKNGNMVVSTSNNDKDMVKYEYDTNNRLIKMIYPNNIIVRYTYDENGNIKTVTDKDGLKTIYTYDVNDNEVLRTIGIIETVKRYDADNRLIRIQNKHKGQYEMIRVKNKEYVVLSHYNDMMVCVKYKFVKENSQLILYTCSYKLIKEDVGKVQYNDFSKGLGYKYEIKIIKE